MARGRMALRRTASMARAAGDKPHPGRARPRPSGREMTLSYVPIEGSPEPFYR